MTTTTSQTAARAALYAAMAVRDEANEMLRRARADGAPASTLHRLYEEMSDAAAAIMARVELIVDEVARREARTAAARLEGRREERLAAGNY